MLGVQTSASNVGHGKDDCAVKTCVSPFPVTLTRLSTSGELLRT